MLIPCMHEFANSSLVGVKHNQGAQSYLHTLS